MRTAKPGIDLIKRFEGLELEAYQDIAGIWSIAYGFTGEYPEWLRFPERRVTDRVGPGQKVTAEEAERLLTESLVAREALLNGWMITTGVTLVQHEYDALISFIYNVGFDAFKGSTAARWLREDKPREQVAEALTWWQKARVPGSGSGAGNGKLVVVPGLVRRREAERAMFLNRTPPMKIVPLVSAANDNIETGARPEKENRPLITYLPGWAA